MKNIEAILAEVELDDDAKAKIIEGVNANYRSINEVNQKTEKISTLENQAKQLQEQIDQLSAKGEDVDALKEQVETFKREAAEREAAEREAIEKARFAEHFEAILGDKQFANDLMRESVLERVYNRCKDNTAVGISDALESVTKDQTGIWLNPQKDVKAMPDKTVIAPESGTENDVMRKFAAQIFGGKSKE